MVYTAAGEGASPAPDAGWRVLEVEFILGAEIRVDRAERTAAEQQALVMRQYYLYRWFHICFLHSRVLLI